MNNGMSVDTALCIRAWVGVVLIGLGAIGLLGAMFWAFDPRQVQERDE